MQERIQELQSGTDSTLEVSPEILSAVLQDTPDMAYGTLLYRPNRKYQRLQLLYRYRPHPGR